MATLFSTQQPAMGKDTSGDTRLFSTENAPVDIDNGFYDPMDISPIKPSPARQPPNANGQPAGSVFPQKSTAASAYSEVPVLDKSAPRLVASLDDPNPWGPWLNSPYIRPRFRFSPKSKTPNRMKQNSIAIVRPDFNRTKAPLLSRNKPTFAALNRDMRPTGAKSVVNDTGVQSGGVSNNHGPLVNGFHKLDIPTVGRDRKADTFASALFGPAPLPRKRTVDDGSSGDPSDMKPQNLTKLPSTHFTKYRRVAQETGHTAMQMTSNDAHTETTDAQTTLEQATTQLNGGAFTTSSRNDHTSLQSLFNPDSTKGPKDPSHVPKTTHNHVFIGSRTGFEQAVNAHNANFPSTSFSPRVTEGPGRTSEPGVGAQVDLGQATIHHPGGLEEPMDGELSPEGELLMPGALSNATPVGTTPLSQVHGPNNISEKLGDGHQTIDVSQSQQSSPSWQFSWDSLQEKLQKAANSTIGRAMTQTFNFAVNTTTALTGTVTQRALKFFQSRLTTPSRRTPAAVAASPTRANLRAFPEEQRRRIKSHQWRKERGYPTVEDYPFPELSFNVPSDPTTFISSSKVAGEFQRSSTTQRHLGMTPQPPKRIGRSGPRTAMPAKGSLLGDSQAGSFRRSRVQSLSPQLKRRMFAGAHARQSRQAQRQRALIQALQTSEHELRRSLPLSATSLLETHIEPTRPSLAKAKLPSDPQRKPKHVRFQEPLTEVLSATSQPLLTELAPHLTPPSPQPNRAALLIPSPIEEEKENVPPISAAVKHVKYTRDEEAQRKHEDWLHTQFPFGRPVSAVRLFYPVSKPLPPGRTESIYAPAWRKIEEEEKKKLKPGRVRPEGAAVRPLPENWETKISEIKAMPNNKQVATTLSGDPLTKRDLATCYTPLAWLNDEIINSYLALIVDYLRRSHNNAGRHDKPRFHAFQTFFFSNLRDKGYQSVRRWATRAKIGGENLLNVDTVFIPVHNSAHWTLIIVKPGERTIENFDSLGALSRRHVGLVQGWLRAELGARYVEDEWTVLPSISPQQDNGSDCGVFLLSTAKAVAIGLEPLSYGARDISLLRRKIVAELINGGLEGDFDPSSDGQTLL